MSLSVAAFYRFVSLSDLPALRMRLRTVCEAHGVLGTILLAEEGINGTIAGAPEAMEAVIAAIEAETGISKGQLKFSFADAPPFARLKVRIRPEIITLRAPEADPSRRVGTYVAPRDWNALIADPGVLVLDTRNAYETKVGTFEGAVDPGIAQFTDFKRFVEERLDPARDTKVAMFCTGGIRCEKASAYLLERGFAEVFHLEGGILKYLEAVPAAESRWQGECYVFDGRVALGHGLAGSDWRACHGCGAPLTPDDRVHPHYEEGVSCAACAPTLSEERARGLRMRHRQMTGR